MYQQTNELTVLAKSLSQFGLRPIDWKLSKKSEDCVKIENKEEPSFYFIGKLKLEDGQTKWNTIQLASL